jgi:hypothetical protein
VYKYYSVKLKLKMMKKLLVVLLAAFIAIPAFPQFLKLGIKAGVSSNTISMNKVQLSGAVPYTIDALSNASYGFHGGLFLRLKISALFIQPEVLFSTSQNKYNVTNVNAGTTTEVLQQLNNLSIPVMVGLKFGPVRINAGPAGTIAIGSPKALINDPNYKDLYNKMSIGYQAGLGIDILKKLTIDMRYEGSLQKYQNQIQNAGVKIPLDNRPNAFLMSVGLMF